MSENTSNTNDDSNHPIPSTSILQLILAHLTEIGCHASVARLQQESGVGLAAPLVAKTQLQQWVQQGQWDLLLRSLSVLHSSKSSHGIVAAVTAQAILELADQHEWETASALLRTMQQRMEDTTSTTLSKELSARLAALAAVRDQDRSCAVPADYYTAIVLLRSSDDDEEISTTTKHQKKRKEPPETSSSSSSSSTRQSRRDALAQEMAACLPQQPSQRLPALLQQAVQWQTHTGQFPLHVAQQYSDAVVEGEEETTSSNPPTAQWDLVLGQAQQQQAHARRRRRRHQAHPHPHQRYATIKFGASAVCTAAAFGSHPTLVTGSSDGFIELWDSTTGDLRKDLPYQTDDAVLTHDGGGSSSVTAMAVANDGTLLATAGSSTVCIWRLDTGSLLRRFALSSSITTLTWAPTAERLLVGCQDGSVREFGLRSGRQLKLFLESSSTTYVTCALYHAASVVTASGDGAMRWWDGASADCRQVVVVPARGVSVGDRLSSSPAEASSSSTAPPLHTLLLLRPHDAGGDDRTSWILVPRGHRAVRILQDDGASSSGARVQQIYDSPTSIMTAATASSHHVYIATEDGALHVYELDSGNRLRTLTTSLVPGSTLVYRPFSEILAVFSADRSQKKGKLYLWK